MDTESLQSSEIWEANMVDGNYDMNIGYTTSGVAQYRTAFRYFVADVLPDDTENTAGSTWIWGTNHDPKLTEETWGITYAASEAEYLEHVKNLQKMASEDLFAFALCWERAFFPYRTDKYEGFSNWNSWGVIMVPCNRKISSRTCPKEEGASWGGERGGGGNPWQDICVSGRSLPF